MTNPTIHLFEGHKDGSAVGVTSAITKCCKVFSIGLPKDAQGTIDPAAVTCPGEKEKTDAH